jgi:hypothetical protein
MKELLKNVDATQVSPYINHRTISAVQARGSSELRAIPVSSDDELYEL